MRTLYDSSLGQQQATEEGDTAILLNGGTPPIINWQRRVFLRKPE